MFFIFSVIASNAEMFNLLTNLFAGILRTYQFFNIVMSFI